MDNQKSQRMKKEVYMPIDERCFKVYISSIYNFALALHVIR